MKRLSINFLMAVSLLALVSCGGSDDNKGNSAVGYGTTVVGSTGYQAQSEVNLMMTLKNSLNCQNGNRLQQDLVYSIQASSQSTRVCGQFTEGAVGGSPGQLYVGVSPYNDIMLITEMTNGSSVVGYNVHISMCSQYMNYYGTQLPLVSDERRLGGFQAPNCIVLDKDNYCPHGVVDAAINTYMVSQAYQYQLNGYTGTLNPFQVWTTFFKPSCNNQF